MTCVQSSYASTAMSTAAIAPATASRGTSRVARRRRRSSVCRRASTASRKDAGGRLVCQHPRRHDGSSLTINQLLQLGRRGNAGFDGRPPLGRKRSVRQGAKLGHLMFTQPRRHVAHCSLDTRHPLSSAPSIPPTTSRWALSSPTAPRRGSPRREPWRPRRHARPGSPAGRSPAP
jgi:hypothetical protein